MCRRRRKKLIKKTQFEEFREKIVWLFLFMFIYIINSIEGQKLFENFITVK